MSTDVEIIGDKVKVKGKEYTKDEARDIQNEIDAAVRTIETRDQGFVAEISADGTYIKIAAIGVKQTELLRLLEYAGIPKK